MKKDITHLDDICLLVDSFYERVREDELIGGIFTERISDWKIHLDKMYRFWQTILLEEHTYNGAPFPPHAQMPIQGEHFDRWIQLWTTTVDVYFEGTLAEEAKWRGQRMAGIFMTKLSYMQNGDLKPLL